MGDDRRISPNECMAARHLHADGYSTADIAMMLEVSDVAVARHVREDCGHPDDVEPVSVTCPTGDDLRRRRKAHGLTQAALAERVGVSSAAVSRWERESSHPRPTTARRVVDALDDA